MDAEDAAGSPTDANNDTLVRVTMTQGSDINWAAISVKISVTMAHQLPATTLEQRAQPLVATLLNSETRLTNSGQSLMVLPSANPDKTSVTLPNLVQSRSL